MTKLKERANITVGTIQNADMINVKHYTVDRTGTKLPSYYRATATTANRTYQIDETVSAGDAEIDDKIDDVTVNVHTRAVVSTSKPVQQTVEADGGEWRRTSTSESAWGGWRFVPDTGNPVIASVVDKEQITAEVVADVVGGNLIRDPTFKSVGVGQYWSTSSGGDWTLDLTAHTSLGVSRSLKTPAGNGTISDTDSTLLVQDIPVDPNTNYKVRLKAEYENGFVGTITVSVSGIAPSGATTSLGSFSGTSYAAVASTGAAEEISGKIKIPAGSYLSGTYKAIRVAVLFVRSTTLNNPTDKFAYIARPAVMRIVKAGDIIKSDDTTVLTDDAFLLSTVSTGWTAATGTAARTTFDQSTVTTAELAKRVKALIDDLLTRGVIST